MGIFSSSGSSNRTPHAVLPKLFAIKGIVFLSTSQTIIFTILSFTGAAKPSSTLSYNDIYFGILSILTSGEMVLFSSFNFHAYSYKPYTIASPSSSTESQYPKDEGHYHGGFMGIKALSAALNPIEMARGLVLAVLHVKPRPQPQEYDDLLPLRQGGEASVLPPYMPPASSNNARYQTGPREYSPSRVGYGRVDRYTPLRR